MGTSLLSPVHLAVLLVIALLLFGAKRLPEIGRSLGSGMREFKDSVSGMSETTRVESHAELPPPAPAPLAAAEPSAPVAAPAADAGTPAAPSAGESERQTVS
jgi:sec-independent protein translocase protein TatA